MRVYFYVRNDERWLKENVVALNKRGDQVIKIKGDKVNIC